ncbi:unnamed protein product [Candida verbasci]|uniref:Uncharacterized protein n=1 Tax=Candida verbasci TaxID=1227364 RepID=A0A9W4TXD3_9ASCO|nr:unnamed protein product [Candida verbasci]
MNLLILFIIGLAAAFKDAPTILSAKQGVICSPIHQSKEKAFIELKDDNNKIPTLIFKYIDLVNFTNIPIIEEFHQLYPNEKPTLYKNMIKDGKFNVDAAEGYKVDDGKFYNGDSTVKFTVPDSGIYCIYIAPDKDKEFSIPVVFKNSYGNLPYSYYMIYSQLKWFILISIALFAYLLNYILKFKVGDDFKNLDSISVISKGIIFLILAPAILVSIVQWINFFLKNWFVESCSQSFFMDLLSFLTELVNHCFNAYTSFIVLLFSMGYGVIYYHNGNSHHYRMFPQKSLNRVASLLFLNILVMFLYSIAISLQNNKPYVVGIYNSPQQTTNQPGPLALILAGLNSLFAIIWFVLTIVFYFKTKKTIAKFPPAPNEENTEKVGKAFKRSILALFVLPFVVFLVGGIILGVLMTNQLKDIPEYPSNTERELLYQSVLEFMLLEKFMNKLILPSIWSAWLYFILLVGSIFFIWIKDNNGLIIDRNANDPIEYAEVDNNFEISDEE